MGAEHLCCPSLLILLQSRLIDSHRWVSDPWVVDESSQPEVAGPWPTGAPIGQGRPLMDGGAFTPIGRDATRFACRYGLCVLEWQLMNVYPSGRLAGICSIATLFPCVQIGFPCVQIGCPRGVFGC